MELTEDNVLQPVVCTIAEKDDFICPAVKSGACTVYTNDGVKARERMGYCPFKSLRKPVVTAKKKRTNPQKASKRKIKVGSIEVDDA